MPVILTKPAEQVNITSGEYDTLLNNVQANILWAHGRNHARHLFIQFTGDADGVRRWIREILAPAVTTARQQLDQIIARETNDGFDGGLVTGFSLSAQGYKYLGLDTKRFESVFRRGMKSQKTNPLEAIKGSRNKDPKPQTWEPGFQGEIHALVTVADAREAVVDGATHEITASLVNVGTVLTVEAGTVLRRKTAGGEPEPVEHFGYFDGISNPLFTTRDLAKERPENIARERWDPGAPLSLVLADDPHSTEADAYGSYLVYRKLAQNVEVFEQHVMALAQSLNVDPDLAGAMVVGRFRDGTPVVRDTMPSPGQEVVNDFTFEEDEGGFKCPFHAHIRKVNPRGTTPLTSSESERRRRIVRRGIPYGLPMPGVADPMPSDPDPSAPRGLLFMCFQQDIDRQFEFIQRTWVDSVIFPKGILLQGNTGDDPLIGQDPDEAQRWPKRWGDEDAGRKVFNFESAVTLKGGEYLFAPSIPFITSL
jgi:Dyp-type peroxidase family